jgi:pilus assembly protein CpaB
MKQKNLIMLGVAVGCGLVAAFAVAKLGARTEDRPESVKVLVAKKDIPIRTKLNEKELTQWVEFQEIPKHLVSPDALNDLEKVKNLRVSRTLKKGNVVSQGDVGATEGITLPEGFKHFTLKTTQANLVGGFALPGSKLDVMAIERIPGANRNRHRAGIILKDMLVLAVNDRDTINSKEGESNAIKQIETVSLAVTDRQAARLALFDERGTLKFILRGTSIGNIPSGELIDDGAIEWEEIPEDGQPVPVPQPSVKLDSMVVVKKSVPLNAIINQENAKEYFTLIDVKTVPEGCVQTIEELLGKYIVAELTSGQFVFKNVTGTAPKVVRTPESPKPPTPGVAKADPPKPKDPTKWKKFEQVIVESGTVKTILWAEIAPDKWKRFDSLQALENYKPETDK